jgi:hypothetical protein
MLSSKGKFIDVEYMLSDFLLAFMMLRFFFLARTLLNLNLFSELTSKRICGDHNVKPGPGFSFKALIIKRPTSSVLITSVISIMWLSYLLRIFERYVFFRIMNIFSQDRIREAKSVSI